MINSKVLKLSGLTILMTVIAYFLVTYIDPLRAMGNTSTIPWLERLMAYPLPRRFMMMIGEIGLSVLLFMLYKQQCVSKENEG